MSENFLDHCLLCGAGIPDGTIQCPGCNSALAFCDNEDCVRAFPASASQCPHCGTANSAPQSVGSGASSGDSEAEGETIGMEEITDGLLPDDVLPQAMDMDMEATHRDVPSAAMGAPGQGFIMEELPANDAATLAPGAGLLEDLQVPPQLAGTWPPHLAPPGAAGSASQVGLEIGTEGLARVGQSCCLRARLLGDFLLEPIRVEVRVESPLWTPPARYSVTVMPGNATSLPAMMYIPTLGGQFEVAWTITTRDPRQVPLQRWSGRHLTSVEDPRTNAQPAIHAGAHSTIILGDNSPPKTVDPFGGMWGGGAGVRPPWERVPLAVDAAFSARCLEFVPKAIPNRPASPPPHARWLSDQPLQILLKITEPGASRPLAILVCLGHEAVLGRGGDPAVAWWLQPHPGDDKQMGRLSRRHARVRLDDNLAWVGDLGSTNHTWLNEDELPAPQNNPRAEDSLAEGDILSLARAMPLRVGLIGDPENGVTAIRLRREDGLARRLEYWLMDNRFTIPWPNHRPTLWWCWGKASDQSPRLAVHVVETAKWVGIPPDREWTAPDGRKFSWTRLEEPLEQPQLLH